jgi:hypothetical protein
MYIFKRPKLLYNGKFRENRVRMCVWGGGVYYKFIRPRFIWLLVTYKRAILFSSP